MTLIEVLVALALFSIIAIVFLSGLTVAARAVLIGDVRTTAESLARAQMEYIKSQNYTDPRWGYELTSLARACRYEDGEQQCPNWWSNDPETPPRLDDRYHAYTVTTEAEPLHEDPEDPDSPVLDGIQKITVIVSHDGKVVFTLEGYNRDKDQGDDGT